MILPVPTPDESVERFTIRAHRILGHIIQDPMERNEVVWSQWRKHRGDTEEEAIARRTFSADRYRSNPKVCVFSEHSAVDAKGHPRQYGLKELVRICRAGNHRIADFDGFSPLSDGHTPDPSVPFQQEPEILGYAGPYALGMIGRKDPRWAIFADEWHMNETADRLASRPRRSVELWTTAADPKRAHFDPIAAIGSETPRLSLPVRYRRQVRDGVVVEKYSFDAPSALPGAGSTFLKQEKYEETGSMLDQDTVAQLMAAISETPQFQFLDQLMQQQQAAAPEEGLEDGAGPPDASMEPPTEAPPEEATAGGDDEDLGDISDLIVDGEEPEKNGMVGDVASMANPITATATGLRKAGQVTGLTSKNCREQMSRDGDGTIVEKYSALRKAHNSVVQELGRMAAQVKSLYHAKADAERAAQIHKLAAEYEGIIEPDEELEVCLYSRGSTLDDAAFKQRIESVQKYAHRANQQLLTRAPDIPAGRLDRAPMQSEEAEKYTAALATEAVRIHTEAVNRGDRGMTYLQAKEEAKKRLAS
jgi:hypothetical protein